ncbi:uncharacterized protein At2g29880-like [Magnolia sinica]|uniref:uncharacterized protein At2g29880-like n=1 Tax=Magnolia sinica TaxID=86752 RepID=UPI002658FA2D|nr:uncharacterized protein At2g29880-like [Magnolia sinica]
MPSRKGPSPKGISTPRRKIASTSKTSRVQWTDKMDNSLVDALVEQVNMGLKSDIGFKPEAYKATIKAINDTCGILLENRHISNCLRTLKRLYWAIKDLLNASGFGWDHDTKMVVATDDVWDGYLATHPYADRVQGKHIDKWDDLAFIFRNECAYGSFVSTAYSSPISGKRRHNEISSDDASDEEASDTVRLSSDDEDDQRPTPRTRRGDGSTNITKKRITKALWRQRLDLATVAHSQVT